MTPIDDPMNEMVKVAQTSDLKAFEQIVRKFERLVRSWVAVHCPPGISSDDIAQNTFIAAYRCLKEFQPGTSFQAWLLTIARYQLMTELTRLRRLADYHEKYGPDLLLQELERQSQDSTDEPSIQLNFLKECLNEVEESRRQFLDWRYEKNISLVEMSKRTGRSVASIKKLLFMLRRQLQECVTKKFHKKKGYNHDSPGTI